MYPQAPVTKRIYAIIGIVLVAGLGLWVAMRPAALTGQLVAADTFTATGPNGEKPNANGIIKIPKGSDITIQWNFPGKKCIAGEGNNDWYWGEGLNINSSGNIRQGESGTVTLHNRQRIESFTLECHLQFSAIWQIPLISKTIIVVFDDLDFAPPAPNTFELIGSNGARMNAGGILTVPSGTDVIVQWNYPNRVCVPQQPPSPNELYFAQEWIGTFNDSTINQESVGVRVLRARTQNESYRIKCDKDSTFMTLNKPTPIDETRSMVIGASVLTGTSSSSVTTPSVDVKINGQDGIVAVPRGATVTVSWTTTGVARCDTSTALAPWGPYVSKPTNGSEQMVVTQGLTVGLQCARTLTSNMEFQDATSGIRFTQCSDGVDNDGDGKIDTLDAQCDGVSDDNESSAATGTSSSSGVGGAISSNAAIGGGTSSQGVLAAAPAGSVQGPSVCTTICGDGVVIAPEQCDDGNAVNTDECNNTCGFNSSSSSSSASSVSSVESSSSSSAGICIPGQVCPNGAICPQNGTCPGICIPGTLCPTGAICPANGLCPGACVPGDVCPNGAVCPANGTCPGVCVQGTICPTGDVCPANGFCPGVCTPGTTCPNGAVCPADGICPSNCVAGTLCPSGAVCPENGVCPSGCLPGTLCPNGSICPANGVCEDTPFEACEENAQCGSNLCIGGSCTCSGSEDCDGNACVGGFCTNIPAMSSDALAFAICASDAECPAGMLCQGGYCGANPALCGNGRIDGGEACDDGNDTDDDSCTNGCLYANGMACENPRQCQTLVCANGVCGNCTSDTQCPDDMICAEGACAKSDRGDDIVVLADGYRISASLLADLGLNPSLLPKNLTYEEYQRILRQRAAGHAPIGNTGPETVAVMAAGASAGYAWMKLRRKRKS